MHLSLLSDGYFSDVVDDAGLPAPAAARAHRDGLVRGVVLIGIAAVLIGLTMLSGTLHSAEADTRCRTPVGSPSKEAAVWWEASTPFARSTDGLRPFRASDAQSGTAVSLVALRQRYRSFCR